MGKIRVIAITAIIFFATVLIVYAWTGNYSLEKHSNKDEIRLQSSSLPPIDPNPSTSKTLVNLYFSNKDFTQLVEEKRQVPFTDRLESTLVLELIKGPSDSKLNATMPKETGLISIDIVEGIAFVNFTREIQLKHWGGSSGELNTLASIVYTLTQLNHIHSVQILIEGKRVESLLGHVRIMDPLTKESVGIGN